MFVFLSLIIILTNFKDIYNLTQFSKTFIRWKKVIKILVTNLWRFPLRLHRDFSIMYNQKFRIGLQAFGNLIFQVDKSVLFFSSSCRKIMFVTRIIIRNCHQRAAKEIERASNILVMAGAGLSTPSGIPDFRTPG